MNSTNIQNIRQKNTRNSVCIDFSMEPFRWIFVVFLWKNLILSICYSETIKLVIRGEQGKLETPNYPVSYPLNFSSHWSIQGPRNSILQLNFSDFNIESNKKCLYDYVKIGNGNGEWTPRYCGNTVPPGYTSTHNHIDVIFVSDTTTSRRGFKAKWKALGTKKKDSVLTIASLQPSSSTSCNTKHTITVTDQLCTEAPAPLVTVTSCSCPPKTSTVPGFAPTSSIIPNSTPASTVLPFRPIKHVVDADPENNTVAGKCPQGRDLDRNGSRDAQDNKLIIILGALTAAFFCIDLLLIVLWCRRHKRNNRDVTHDCKTELPPIELKIVNGKIISSPRTAGPRVKYSDHSPDIQFEERKKMQGNRRCNSPQKRCDGNGNHRKDRGIDLLKDSRYVDHEGMRLVSTHHGEML